MVIKRPSRREHLQAVKATLAGLAVMAGKQPQPYTTRIPEQRGPRKPSGEKSEADVNREIREYANWAPGITLWRNNRGQVETAGGGRLVYGVGPNGASDWIGYKRVTVTADMVGKTIAVFTAVEAKRPGKNATEDQQRFIDGVRADGGIAGVAHDAEELQAILR